MTNSENPPALGEMPPPPPPPYQQQLDTAVPSTPSGFPKRQLPFLSTKTPFSSPGDYHRFSSEPRRPHYQDPDAITVKTPPVFTEVTNSSIPVAPKAGKDGKAPKASNVSRSTKSVQQNTNANVGSPGNNLAPTDPCHQDNSLDFLMKKFIDLIGHAKDGILDLSEAAATLGVPTRRIDDITNILEVTGLIEKKPWNKIQWTLDVSRQGEKDENATRLLQAEIENLRIEEHNLDERIREMEEKVRNILEDGNNQRFLFVTQDDIMTLPCFYNETLIAIRAPRGTKVEGEAPDHPQRRYSLELRSKMGPIEVYTVSKFVISEPPAPSPPSPSGLNDSTATITVVKEVSSRGNEIAGMEQGQDVLNSPQDISSGTTKIVPSNADVDADYCLSSDTSLDLTDMWRTDPGLECDLLCAIRNDYYGIYNISTSSIPPPSNPTTEPPPSSANTTPP